MPSNEIFIQDQKFVNVARAAILIDTGNFDPELKKATDTDVQTMTKLETLMPCEDRDKVFKELKEESES